METKHTPGPWEALYDHPDAKTKPAIAYIRATDRTFEIEEIAMLFGCQDNAAQQANARLIAAAPEMFEILSFLMRDCRGCEYPDSHEANDALDRAEKIVARILDANQ